jgi:hypothetical protein
MTKLEQELWLEVFHTAFEAWKNTRAAEQEACAAVTAFRMANATRRCGWRARLRGWVYGTAE